MRRWGKTRLVLAVAGASAAALQLASCFPSLGGLSGNDAGAGEDGATEASAGDAGGDAALDAPPKDGAPPGDDGLDAPLVDATGSGDSASATCTEVPPLWTGCQPSQLVLAGGNLFFTTVANGGHGMWRMATDGGTQKQLYQPYDLSTPPTGLATDGTTVFWSAEDMYFAVAADGGLPPGSPCTAGADSGVPLEGTVVAEGACTDHPTYAALTATDVIYFTDHPGSPGVFYVSRTPGPGAACLYDCPTRTAANSSELATTQSVALLGDYVYYGSGLAILRAPTSAGMLANQANTATQVRNIASDGTSLFWTEMGGAISTLDVTGGSMAPSPVQANRSQPLAIAVDSAHVYWSEAVGAGPAGQIARARKDGTGGVVLLACTPTIATALAVDSQNIYYATPGTPGDASACNANGTIGSFPLPP